MSTATATATVAEYWRDICFKAYDEEPKSSAFILFIDNCKNKPPTNGRYIFPTDNPEFRPHLEHLEFELLNDNIWTLSNEKLTILTNIRTEVRADWHINRQKQLKEHLIQTLSEITKPLDITDKQRLVLVQEFINVHRNDLGSRSFLRGLVGCLKYQLQNKYHMVEWKMDEAVLTQNNEEPMDQYIRLLTGVLCFQLLYRDGADDDSDQIVININEETVHIWQMNPDLDNQFIRSVLELLPKEHNLTDYQVSSVKRKQPPSIFQWICNTFTRCLSFLH
ncbi:hypothetical protein MFLAVUS_002411 [Mucor flavus]|uniref:Uncharacterized protein n=1 Tax=Mucor flavus TaxID=439312 RepID=A0ABP9YQ83_9FUNG